MTVIDLYGGPGGWDKGAEALGLHPVGYEVDEWACATRVAAGLLTIRQDVATAWVPPHDGLIASPPCQAFSMAGDRRGVEDIPRIIRWMVACADGWVEDPTGGEWADDRSKHILQPLRWAWYGKPEWVALEQVPPVIDLWETLLVILQGWGYKGWTAVLNAADFGVPQTRRRAVLVASRTRTPDRPHVTHVDPRKGDSLFHQPWQSMAQALGWGFDDTPGKTVCGFNAPRWMFEGGPSTGRVVLDRRTNSKDGRGGMVPTVPVALDRPAPGVTGKAGGQWVLRHSSQDNATVRTLDRPAATVAFGNDIDRVEWQDPDNAIRVELWELAVLQGFPRDYPFQGTKGKRAEQIGNAVPPALAEAVLRTVVA